MKSAVGLEKEEIQCGHWNADKNLTWSPCPHRREAEMRTYGAIWLSNSGVEGQTTVERMRLTYRSDGAASVSRP